MIPLPIDSSLPQLLATLRANPAAILIAPPGTGKTTRVPPAIIRANILTANAPNLIMLQPRRVAARASAQRIADENQWQIGNEVGYHIRFEKRYAPHTRIRVLTEAILTRILLDDPYLDGIGCVILDEFHERNLHTDLAIAFLREIQQTVRPDLKLLVMSATLDAQPISDFLNHAPILTTESRAHPIQIIYRSARDARLEDHIANITHEALTHDGDILIFLPGKGEIDRTLKSLYNLEFIIQNSVVLPLHGSLSSDEQQRALRPDPDGKKKIILATNIAETSLTIDGVRTVIDTGLARIASFDPDRGMDRLDLARISQASATQRAGRAGRQAPGTAYRLWPEIEQKHLPLFNVPEIQRVDLASTALAVHAWGAKSPHVFGWFEKPADDRIDAAETLLGLLSALDHGTLTPIGRQMLKLPLHPRIARMLVAAAGTSRAEEALNLATILSDDSRSTSDPLSAIDRLSPHLFRNRDQLASIVRGLPPAETSKAHASKISPSLPELLLIAFPDRVAKRRESDPYAAVMVGGSGARLTKESFTPAIAATPLFLALDLHHDPRNKKSEALVNTAIPIDEQWLAHLFANEMRTETALHYDTEKEKVIAATRRYFHDLLLEEKSHGHVDPQKSGPILAEALAPQARALFEKNPAAASLIARLALLRHAVPDNHWPPLDDTQLAALLTEACVNKRTLQELTDSQALPNALRSTLPYPLDRQLDQLAPETLEVPSGSKIKIDYQLPPLSSFSVQPPAFSPPILAVRLQELFGLLDTPRIAAGRVPLLLHLLSPGYKPIQITQDLRSFWSNAYFEVRKDLRTKYPKHKWPDDPLTAKPEAKGRPRR